MIMFTFRDLERTVREIVAADPDHIYRSNPDADPEGQTTCSYSPNSPGAREACLFGQALAALGVPDGTLRDVEGKSIQGVIGDLGLTHAPLTLVQAGWLSGVQSAQDGGLRWSVALMRADEYHPEIYRG